MSGLSLIDVWYRRLPRYLFIADRLRDQPVLELGCGSGLGADFLAEQGAGRVVGVDADERQILKARARYKRSNLSFEVVTGPDLPFADGEFGVVLAPEGSRAIQDPELLASLRRVLRPDGLCLVAAPNGDLEEPEADGLSYYDMIESLEPVFPAVTMVAQTPMLAFTFVDFLASAEDLEVGLDDSLAQDLVDDVAYYVALCAAEPFSPAVFAITQVPFVPVARRVQHLLDGQPPEQVELGELQEALATEREERIRQAEATGELERDILESQEITRQLRARLAAADEAQAEALRQAADEQRRQCDGLRDQAERYAQQAEAAERSLQEARQEAAELHHCAQSHSAALSELEEARERLGARDRERADLAERLVAEQTRADELAARARQHQATQEAAEGALAAVREQEEQQRARVTVLERELDAARGEAEGLGHHIGALERDLQGAREDAEGRGHRIGELERELQGARGEAEGRGHRIGELERELETARGEAEGRGHRIGELERELQGARAEAEGRGHRIGELERELEWARGEAEGRGHRIGELERELETAHEEAEQRKARTGELKRQVELAQAQAAGQAERIEELERKLAATADVARERNQAVTRVEQLREQVAEAEAALGAAQHQCGDLEDRLAARDTRVGELQARLQEVEAARDHAEARLTSLNEELTRARQEISGERQERSVLNERTGAIQTELEASRREVQELTGALDQARHLAAEQNHALQAAQTRVSGLTEQLDAASDQVRNHAEQKERLQQQLLSADEQRAGRDGELRELRRELATAQADRRSLEIRLEQALIRADRSEVSGSELRERQEDLESRLVSELEELRAAEAEAREALALRSSELAEERGRGLAARLADQEIVAQGAVDRLRFAEDALAAREAVLGAVQAALTAGEAARAAQAGELESARLAEAALERALQEERRVREEIEQSLDAVETSVNELSAAGARAVAELDEVRQQAADRAAEAQRWQSECAAAQQALGRLQERATVAAGQQDAVARGETVRRLRAELEAVRGQEAALGAERARLTREASLAEDARHFLGEKLEAAVRAHAATAQGMEMVIARLEAERERADALDREVAELRERVAERGELTVTVTREAAAEAERARRYRRELEEARARIKELSDRVGALTGERQELRRAAAAAAASAASAASEASEAPAASAASEAPATPEAPEAFGGVSDWDAEIRQGRLRDLEAQQARLVAELAEREEARAELEQRLQHQALRVSELLAGAERHRLEMADREIALAEQAAWNAELVAVAAETDRAVIRAREAQQVCEANLAEARDKAKHLAVEVARLEGVLKRRDLELEELRAAGPVAEDVSELQQAVETAVGEAAAFRQRLEEARAELHARQDRVEELEALLELAKQARSRERESPKKRETLIGIGPDTQEIPSYPAEAPAPAAPSVDLAALRRVLDQVGQLEKTCQVEEERIGVLATSLRRLANQTGALQDQLDTERMKRAELEQERRELAGQASRVPELELELEVLRAQSGAGGGAGPAGRVDLAEHLLKEQRILAAEAAQRWEARITALNNTIGDKDAEILLLHASVETIQRRAKQLAANLQEALGGAATLGTSTQALLSRVLSELDEIIR